MHNRIVVMLPEHLANTIRASAAEVGQSLTTWIARAATAYLAQLAETDRQIAATPVRKAKPARR
jgi:hypothetical protein